MLLILLHESPVYIISRIGFSGSEVGPQICISSQFPGDLSAVPPVSHGSSALGAQGGSWEPERQLQLGDC